MLTAPVKLTSTRAAAAAASSASCVSVAELAEGDDGDVEVAVGGSQALDEPGVLGGLGGVERHHVDAHPAFAAAPSRRRRRACRAASTTVSVAGDTRASTIALPMSLVPPKSTIVWASPRALSITTSTAAGPVRSRRRL